MRQEAPSLALLAREIGAFPLTRLRASLAPPVQLSVQGGGHGVVVLPGFMASDGSTTRLRRSLNEAGFSAHGWGLGRNYGIRQGLFERLADRLAGLDLASPPTLVGWSLGGVIAREYAKRHPAQIARVVTLGSPYSGDPRINRGWRLYELVARHSVDSPPIAIDAAPKPPVPTLAFWSRRDGIVAGAAARGIAEERDDAIEVDCRHMEFVAGPAVIRALADALARN